ncbi:hypothetical protein [Peribacillus sp. N1]
MMDTVSIIQSVERLGAQLSVGDHIRIKKGVYLPDSITASIGDYKQEILAVLERDNKAKQTGFMIGIPGEVYTVTLSKFCSIYVEHIEDGWEAWREKLTIKIENRLQKLSLEEIHLIMSLLK